MEELVLLVLRDFGPMGLILGAGFFGYIQVNKRLNGHQLELHQVERETQKIELIEHDLKEDIKEIKDSINDIRQYILYGKQK